MAVAERHISAKVRSAVNQSVATQSAVAQSTMNGGNQHQACPDCEGTGSVTFWNEVAYFEDRRGCTRCDAGRDFEERLADIIERAVVTSPQRLRR